MHRSCFPLIAVFPQAFPEEPLPALAADPAPTRIDGVPFRGLIDLEMPCAVCSPILTIHQPWLWARWFH